MSEKLTMHYSRYIKAFLLGFSFLFFLNYGCDNSKQNAKNPTRKVEQKTGVKEKTNIEGHILFDGNSLDGWEVTQFGTEGPVQVSDNKIILGMGDGLTGITWSREFPKMNYEVNLEAMRMSGNDFFCGITFPFDTTWCSFIVGGWAGPVVGLSTIDGADASENSTKTLMRFEKNVWYKVRLRVTPGKIEGWVDNKKVVNFATEGHEVYIRPEVSLSRPFGIASWITTAALRDIRLKYLSDEN